MKFRSKARSPKFRNRGFTLIEMMVVITLILILLSIAVPMYNQSIIRARETTLKQNLATLNKVIDQYTLDKQKAPQSLEDLVSAGYLKVVPNDITGSKDSWVLEQEDSLKSSISTRSTSRKRRNRWKIWSRRDTSRWSRTTLPAARTAGCWNRKTRSSPSTRPSLASWESIAAPTKRPSMARRTRAGRAVLSSQKRLISYESTVNSVPDAHQKPRDFGRRDFPDT